jgi:hypothetical protein
MRATRMIASGKWRLRSSKSLVVAGLGALFTAFGGVASSSHSSAAATGPPVNAALPAISGSVVVGQTLTADPGSWTNSPTGYGYQWLQCDSGGASCVAISGAAASTYVLVRADLGKTIRVTVTASNDAGSSAPATSNQTVKVAGTLPQNTSAPTFSPMSGLAAGATTVTVTSNGTWSGVPTPTQWAYQWQSCTAPSDGSTCAAIAGATASSYALAAAQVGSYIRLGVKATNVCSSGCGSTWAYSAESDRVGDGASGPPVNSVLPSISGSVVVGQTLTADPGGWTNAPTAYAYQWLQCDASGANCVAISGATAATYVLARADLGKTVRVSVTASNDAGSSAPATSNQTGKVAGTLPQNTSPPTFSPTSGLAAGVTTVSVTSNGTWSGVPTPTQWAYQWQSCTAPSDGSTCAAIAGATASSYALAAAQVGSYIRLGVKATNVCSSGCGSTWAYSAESAEPVVGSAPANTVLPSISGSAQAGQTLTTTSGGWTNYPTGYAYQWRRCDTAGSGCTDIAGATSATYAVGQIDVGATLRVRVTATNGIGSGTANSAATDQVASGPPPPSNTSQPTISGTTREGELLTADPGGWTGDGIVFSYRWRRCTQTAISCADIGGATGATYTLTSVDVGARIQVVVTAANAGGSAQATSGVTSVVSAVPQPTGDPAVAAAGDIACDPSNTHFNNGFGTSNDCHELATSSLLLGAPLAGVLPLGDNQYGCGGYQAFLSSYDPSWGRLKSITHPAIGNHEYLTSSDEGSTDCDPTGSAAGYFGYFGAAAGDPSKGYYSYDLAGWHFVVLNSNCAKSSGCYAGSVQEKWLKADLAAHPTACTLAYWHHPRFSSVTSSSAPGPYFNDLAAAGADVVLTGHVHNYERFAPQNGVGGYDAVGGVREFVVGTGGESLQGFPTAITNSEVQLKRFGVLMLTLHATSYEWAFVGDDGITFDSGTGYCH